PAALTRGLACASPWLRRPASRGGRRPPAPARELTRSGNLDEQRHSESDVGAGATSGAQLPSGGRVKDAATPIRRRVKRAAIRVWARWRAYTAAWRPRSWCGLGGRRRLRGFALRAAPWTSSVASCAPPAERGGSWW